MLNKRRQNVIYFFFLEFCKVDKNKKREASKSRLSRNKRIFLVIVHSKLKNPWDKKRSWYEECDNGCNLKYDKSWGKFSNYNY
jgi:hypothetical protein